MRVGYKRKEVAGILWMLLPRKEMGNGPRPVPEWSMSVLRWRWLWEAS